MFMLNSILFLAVWINLSFAEELSSDDAASAKQAPAFQGMNEKKDFTSSEHEGELSKKVQINFEDTRDKKNLNVPSIENNFLRNEFDKRAPRGFQGMRGKKDYLVPNFEDTYSPSDYEKRAPMGFQGMRGKKSAAQDAYYKRAPMDFQEMRRKKSLEEYPQGYEKRLLAMGFQGMRGKKEEFPAEWEKRARMGFQGMRGKKTLFDEIEELEKRAIMGFQGTRGKKDVFENYVDYYMDPVDFKRAPMGFQGMRGKKNTGPRFGIDGDFETRSSIDYQGIGDSRNDLASCQVEKRSPFRYFEMRGKKNPRWGLRGKFVGVRGKKWQTAPYKDDSPFLNDYIERIGADGDSSATLDLQ